MREKKKKDLDLFSHSSEIQTELVSDPEWENEEIPNTLNLGWIWNEEKKKFKMAKIAQEDRLTHFYIVGATGTGKTKLIEFLIQQDIADGNGFAVIDPHGDLIENIKGFLAYRYR